jgi:hypothetical protein
LWLVGSDGTYQRIASEAAQSPPYPDELGFHLGAGAIASRDFETAASLMGGYRSRNPGDLRSMMLEVYALCMLGDTDPCRLRLGEHAPVFDQYAPGYSEWVESIFLPR